MAISGLPAVRRPGRGVLRSAVGDGAAVEIGGRAVGLRWGDFALNRFRALPAGRIRGKRRYSYLIRRRLGGAMRPAELVLVNAINQGEESALEYSDRKLRELPGRLFSKDYLKRLQ